MRDGGVFGQLTCLIWSMVVLFEDVSRMKVYVLLSKVAERDG